MSMIFTEAVLMRSLVIFLLLGSIVGLLAGALLLWRPQWLARVSKLANSWVSTRQIARPLDQPINIDHWIYHYGRWTGAVLLAGALYIIYMFTAHVERDYLLVTLARVHLVSFELLQPVLDALVLIFLMGAALALLVSQFLLFRPSMLRDLDIGANQSVSLRQSLKPMEIQHAELDQLVSRNVRLAGVLLLCGSLYSLVGLTFWLGR